MITDRDRSDDIIEEFNKAGLRASYFYADDSTREWDKGDEAKGKALAIFDAHPELQDAMREVAREFLWSLNRARPKA